MPAITGRLGLILTVNDPALSAEWYRAVFGFTVLSEQTACDGQVDQICLEDAGSRFTLCVLSHASRSGDAFTEFRTGLDHVEFFVASGDDLATWADWLDQLGIPHSGIKSPSYTVNRMITFRDPDNIQLELFYEGPRG